MTFLDSIQISDQAFTTVAARVRAFHTWRVIFATPEKPLQIPYPSSIMPWKRDAQNRLVAKVPIAGTIMRLEGEVERAAREQLKDPTLLDNKPPIVFEIEFLDGERGLFTPIEGPFAYASSARTAGS